MADVQMSTAVVELIYIANVQNMAVHKSGPDSYDN